MSQPGKLIVQSQLDLFFATEVAGAVNELGYQLGEMTQLYLVKLLCAFSRQEGLQARIKREPLAFIYKRAQEADSTERAVLLKDLGDIALYTSGFFTDAIERSMVDIDYYISMGGGAYQSLGSLLSQRPQRRSMAKMYSHMGDGFTRLVDVLNQIADRSHASGGRNGDLLKLYDRWARTGSERIGRMLLERGLPTTINLPTAFDQ